ncbi:high mobility group box domain-containing protein, partial [Elsinoe ampelina]
FILYRQHHNASVITRYPNMSNPEISKIIGELWRSEPEEEKNRWKSFAEEDKIQHAQKYPSYRYQPKRTNK